MIIVKDQKPVDTIFYTSGCILNELDIQGKNADKLFDLVKEKYNSNLSYTNYLLALDLLFLTDKILIDERGLICDTKDT